MRSSLPQPVILMWVMLTTFAPPGLPSCWIERVPCEIHTHFNEHQAQSPHSHFYLIDLSLGLASQPYPFLSVSATIFISLLAASGAKVRRGIILHFFSNLRWKAAPEPPPPKTFLFSMLPGPRPY